MQDIPILLFGAGGVGRALLRQLMEHRSLHAIQYGLRFSLMAVCDSNGAVIDESGMGLDDELLADMVAWKEAGKPLASHAQGGPQGDPTSIVDIAGRDGAIVVDCTASEDTVSALLFALGRRYKIVLANKKPLTVGQDIYDLLTGASEDEGAQRAPRHLGRCRWETTVGAGLPVIAMLNRLVGSGDEIERITGTFSGTLGYVMTGLDAEQRFSAIVRQAHRLGYTEPDPRDDLGGTDVARKALILARGLGWKLNLADVNITRLHPATMESLSVAEFMDELPALDEEFAARAADARAAGKVLRYAATITGGQCSVGLDAVAADSPLGRLQGTDNLVAFTTRWYNSNPLVIQGAGAGTNVTAAGVLSDIVELAYSA